MGIVPLCIYALIAMASLPTPAAGESFVLMTRDINPASEGSYTHNLTDVSGSVFFTGSVTDTESFSFINRLWVSNGTELGTVRLEGSRSVGITAADPADLVDVNGVLFFTADGRDLDSDPRRFFGRELWRSDGTESGTVLVADIAPGFASSQPNNLVNVGGKLFFGAFGDDDTGRELWMSDGIPGGATVRVKDINPGNASSIGKIGAPIAVGDTLYFWADDGSTGFELWRSDGSSPGTTLVKDINDKAPGASSAGFEPNPGVIIGSRVHRSFDPVQIDGILYFPADDGAHGVELWRSDGTPGGTNMVTDLKPGEGSSEPGWLTVMNGRLFFTADDGAKGRELFTTDGYATGTRRVADIHPDSPSSRNLALHDQMVVLDGTLFFAADDGTRGNALWKSDGSEAGTVPAVDFNLATDGFEAVNKLTAASGLLYLAADDGDNGVELWQSDGTHEGSHRWDIAAGSDSSISLVTGPRPIDFVASGPRLFFPAWDGGRFGDELWVTASEIPENFDPDRTRTHGGTPPGDPPGADLDLVRILSVPATVNSDELFTYRYIVVNKGPDLAVGVVLSDLYPPGVTVAFPDVGCTPGGGPIKFIDCEIGNLPSGFAAIVSVMVRAPVTATPILIDDDASVKHAGRDPEPINNRNAVRTTVRPPPPPPPAGSADLALTKWALRDPVVPGTDIEYRLVVVNQGPTDATGVTVTDPLPPELTFRSASAEPEEACAETDGTLTCAFPMLAAGDFVEIELIATAPTTAATVRNLAEVSANQDDPDPSNNEAWVDTVVEDLRPVPESGMSTLTVAALATLATLCRRRRAR